MIFEAEAVPFPRWLGPFSPARGTYSGFRFHHGRIGTWVENSDGREFWTVADSPGVQALRLKAPPQLPVVTPRSSVADSRSWHRHTTNSGRRIESASR